MFRKKTNTIYMPIDFKSKMTFTYGCPIKAKDITKISEWWKTEHQKLAMELSSKLNPKLKELGYDIDKLEITF